MAHEIYSHWAAAPLVLKPDFPYDEDRFKPSGLWFDVNGEWNSWCDQKGFRRECLQYRNVLDIDVATLLRLSTPTALDAFSEKYKRTDEDLDSDLRRIDWARVRTTFKGILIAPYCWQRRLAHHTFWYYIWDCASGCIWDLSAIRGITTEEVQRVGRE